MGTKHSPPLPDRISASFKELSESAARLNTVSDELGSAIRPIDAVLKKLNLGVTAWHQYEGNDDPMSGYYWGRRIGYAKVGGKWGLALSTVSGDQITENEEVWLFNDAPRWMRLEALDHIPDLLETLVQEANQLATDLQEKTGHAREVANTLSELAGVKESRR